MQLWHLAPDTPRTPRHPSGGEAVTLRFGTWPVEPCQAVWLEYRVERTGGPVDPGRMDARWLSNAGSNSYWSASLGPFEDGDRVTYRIRGRSGQEELSSPELGFTVGPKLHIALLWHMHQPLYKDLSSARQQGAYRVPWVRLHAIRDYYAMAALVAQHPAVHVTINLVPSLLWQIEDYVEHGATDRALDLTLKPSATLTAGETAFILHEFFSAHWHHQIFPYPRYQRLFQRRIDGERFSVQDLDDLKMWFNLCWFAPEFQQGAVPLADGSRASVQEFMAKGEGFSQADIERMVAEQYKILRNVIPLHRALQEQGQIEISTTPFYHPILPLLLDTDQATIDRDGATRPARFAWPEDARAQVARAIGHYREKFGRAPRGMWPAEGAVNQAASALFAEAGIEWIATDQGVLARSGRFGYRTDDPDVLCRPYRVAGQDLAVFFRDTPLSDRIGFHYQGYPDAEHAAGDFILDIKERFAQRVDDPSNRVLAIILDGENAWGAYPEAARPFLHALYRQLGADPEIRTVTFSEYLAGNPARHVPAHPASSLTEVHDLFCGSWIDELGSRPGVDLGTWIGEPEENQAWELLGGARRALAGSGATPASRPAAFEALYAAEASDWFWWYGEDQDSGQDEAFDDLFRTHLKNIYRGLDQAVPRRLSRHIVPHGVVWSFEYPVAAIQPGDRFVIQTHCRGVVTWGINGGPPLSGQALAPVGGAMAGTRRHRLVLGPFDSTVHSVDFVFRCTEPGCDGRDLCCRQRPQAVRIETP